jgi:hypothetical protein
LLCQAQLDDTEAKLAAADADRAHLSATIATLTDEGIHHHHASSLK